MEESVKSRIILILAVVVGIFFISTVSSCMKMKSLKRLKDDEMLARLTCQEEVKNIKEGVASNLKSKEKELEDLKIVFESTKKALAQEQLVNLSLKEELVKESKLKEALEDALVKCNKSQKK